MYKIAWDGVCVYIYIYIYILTITHHDDHKLFPLLLLSKRRNRSVTGYKFYADVHFPLRASMDNLRSKEVKWFILVLIMGPAAP
jgi:hypothetical protein